MLSWGRMKPSATWCMVGFHLEQALMTEQGRRNTKLCQKNKEKVKKMKKKNAVINQKGGKACPLWCFPPINLDTIVAFQKTSLYQ